MTKLGEVAEFIRGITFKPDDVVPLEMDDAVVCMRTKNVQATLECDDLLAVPSQFVRRSNQYLNEGDILVSSANSWNLVGKCCWVPSLPWRAAFGGFVSVLRGDAEQVDRRYLYWWFSSSRIQSLLRSFGQKTTNISNLNIDRCLQLDLPLPSLPEQRRIAAILDKADALHSKRREALTQLDSLAQSIFVEMFGDPVTNPKGWPVANFSEFFARPLRNGISPSTAGTVEAGVLTLSSVTGAEFNESAVKLGIFKAAIADEQTVSKNDFLICRGNGNVQLVGKGFFPTKSLPGIAFPDTIIAARIDTDKVEPAFLQHIWNAPVVRAQVEAVARTTNGTFKVNQTMVEQISLLSPPMELQREFSRRVSVISQLRVAHQRAMSESNSLSSSIQNRAFDGQL